MQPVDYVSSLSLVETSEWFDWLRSNLPLGGINLPSEEASVLFIERARHLAARVRATYGHTPSQLEQTFIKGLIIYQCWDLQKGLRETSRRPRRSAILREVAAVSYLRPLGKSGRHHLVEANDGSQYVITVPTGLWTETLPATEVICNALARLAGFTVPSSAVVAVGPQLLRFADVNGPEWLRVKPRRSAVRCCGFRYVCASPTDSNPLEEELDRKIRDQFLGALMFNNWVMNSRPVKYTLCRDDTTGRLHPIFFDHSQCFERSDWNRFACPPAYPRSFACANAPLQRGDEAHLVRWVGRIENLDLNPIWELAFELPSSWYGSRRPLLVSVLDRLSMRKWSLRGEVCDLLASAQRADNAQQPCKPMPGCTLGWVCRSGQHRAAAVGEIESNLGQG
jgi:hypothetical protein